MFLLLVLLLVREKPILARYICLQKRKALFLHGHETTNCGVTPHINASRILGVAVLFKLLSSSPGQHRDLCSQILHSYDDNAHCLYLEVQCFSVFLSFLALKENERRKSDDCSSGALPVTVSTELLRTFLDAMMQCHNSL